MKNFIRFKHVIWNKEYIQSIQINEILEKK